jgi:histidine triad (HIT) family protein
MKAAKKVALLIDKNLGVKRTAMIMEGYGINHLHIKLSPIHGISDGKWKPILSEDKTFYDKYTGMIASNDGPRMSDAKLLEIATKIRG